MSDAILCLGYAVLFAGAFVLAGLVYVGRVLKDFRERKTNVRIESHHHFADLSKLVADGHDGRDEGDIPDDEDAFVSSLNVPIPPDIATDGEPVATDGEPALPDPKPAPEPEGTNLDVLRDRLAVEGIDYRRWRIAVPVPGASDEDKAYNWLHGWSIFVARYRRWEATHVKKPAPAPATLSSDPQSDLIARLRANGVDLVRFRDWLISYQLLDPADPIEGITDDNARALLSQFDYYRERYDTWLSVNAATDASGGTNTGGTDTPVGHSEA